MQHYLLFKGSRIAYEDYGHGNAIVLLHGFLENSKMWKAFVSKLSQSFRVITIDLPGHGQSENIGYVHKMELMAECVHQIVLCLNLSDFILVGHSMGGYVALAYEEKYPFGVKGLILLHSSALADSKEKKDSRLRAIEAAKQNPLLYINTTIPGLFKSEHIEKLGKEIIEAKSIARETSQQGIIAALDGMRRRKDRRKILKNLKHPVLFIIGKFDNAVPLKKVLPQLTLASHSEALILENAGHMGFVEAFNETLSCVSSFAERLFK